jgi:hypothetical protein
MPEQLLSPVKYGNVELIAMRVPNQDVTGVRYVYSVRVHGNVLRRDFSQEFSPWSQHCYAVPLKVYNMGYGSK